MDCPSCGLINRPEAARCDCGYDFKTGGVIEAFGQQMLWKAIKGLGYFGMLGFNYSSARALWDFLNFPSPANLGRFLGVAIPALVIDSFLVNYWITKNRKHLNIALGISGVLTGLSLLIMVVSLIYWGLEG